MHTTGQQLGRTHAREGACEKAGHDGVLVPCQRGRLIALDGVQGEHPAAKVYLGF